ncbi:substrate-binding periplasmic protein [Vibrio bivalvicida]|uniref:Substrate-binding periplasmic protein n=1 Tax=Vibrio bivalvicida TaxID=1276888 RepID=A0ABV4MCP7_9VIBR
MKKIRMFTLLIIVVLAGPTFAKPTKVIIYTETAYPPYSFSDNGKAVGIYPDIVRLIAKQMPEFDIRLEPTPWDRGLKLLEHGKGFALVPPYYLPDIRPYIAPYSKPILEEDVTLYCHVSIIPKLGDSIDWPESFYGLRIGVNSGYHLGDLSFWQAVENGDLYVREAATTKENILKLNAKRNDCYLHIALSVEWTLKQLTTQEIIDTSDWLKPVRKISSQFGYIGYTAIDDQYPFKQKFVEQFNQKLFEQQKSGGIEKVIKSYFD